MKTVIASNPIGTTRQSKKNKIAPLSACNNKLYSLFLMAMYIFFLNPYLDVRGYNAHDPASYINKAISLWKGIGYGEQFADIFLPVTIQPPLFSLFLAPVIGIFGVNFIVLKLFMLVFAAALSFVLFKFFSYFLGYSDSAKWAVLMALASPVIFGLSHRVLADIPVFVFVALSLWSLDNYLRNPGSILSPWLFLSAAASSLAYLTKQTALAVFVGGWFLFLHRDFRNGVVFKKLILYSVIGLIPIVIWHAWCKIIPDDLWYWTTPSVRDYIWKNPFTAKEGFLSLSDFFIRVRHNLVWGISNNIAMAFFAPFYFLEGGLFGFLLSFPIVIWLAWQWGKSFIKQPTVLEGFVFFSLALMVPKYLGMAARYIAMIWPVIIIYFIRALAPLSPKKQSVILNVLIIISLCTTLGISIDQWRNPYGSKTLADYVALSKQAKALLPEGSVCKAPLLTHWQILTGHKCECYGQELVTYFVSLSDTAPQNLDFYRDVERDVLVGARDVGLLWKGQEGRVEKIVQNNTFALFKVKTHGN